MNLPLIGAFVLIERRSRSPLVALSVVRARAFSGAVLANLVANIVFGAVVFFLALYVMLTQMPATHALRVVPFVVLGAGIGLQITATAAVAVDEGSGAGEDAMWLLVRRAD